jgi:hypothetical protein
MSSSLQPQQKVSKRTSRRRRLRSKDNSLEILKYAIYNSYRIKRRAAKEEKRRLEEKTGIISPMPVTLDNNPNKLSLSCKKLDLLKKGLVTALEESKLDAKQTEKKMASHVVNNIEPAKQDCNQTKRVLSVVNGNIINNEKHLEKIRLLERRLIHRKLAV